MSERPTEEPKTSLITKGLYPWGLLILILVTAWLLIGSLWFPAWWFNTLFLGQIFQWQNWKLAIAYLADQERGFLVGIAFAALIAAALVRRLWPRLRNSLIKFHCAIVICCLTTILGVCAVLNATQRQRFVTSGSDLPPFSQPFIAGVFQVWFCFEILFSSPSSRLCGSGKRTLLSTSA